MEGLIPAMVLVLCVQFVGIIMLANRIGDLEDKHAKLFSVIEQMSNNFTSLAESVLRLSRSRL